MKILGILSGTPIWVFLLFGYLIFTGIRATKDRKIHISRVFIIPTMFFTLFAIRLIKISRTDIYATFFVALIAGLVLSYIFLKTDLIKKDGKKIFLKGSYETLVIVTILFCMRYYIGYMKAMNLQSETLLLTEIILSGMMSGFFVSKVVRYTR